MIENMRKYTGLMVVVLILLAAGLIITMNPGGSQGGPNSGDFMSVKGESISRNDYNKLGQRTIEIAMQLRLIDYLFGLGYDGSAKGNVDFVANRIVLRKGAESLGIYPSEAAAEKFLQEKAFLNADGAFDSGGYQNFIKNIADQGFTEVEFKELIADYLVFQKTREVIGGGLIAPRDTTIAAYQSDQQKIELLSVEYDIANFRKAITATDEQVKAYWEPRKEKYPTDRQLKISYVLAHVDSSDRPKKANIPKDMEPAVAAKIALDYDEKIEKWTAENQKKYSDVVETRYNNFYNKVADNDGKQIKETAEEFGLKLVETDFFTKNKAPEELASLSAAEGDSLTNTIFDYTFGTDEQFRIQQFEIGTPMPGGTTQSEGYIFVRLDDEKKPEPKTYEAAKEQAKADYIEEEARKAMIAKAEVDHKAIAEAIKSGKSFQDAAKAQELTVIEVGPFGKSETPQELNDPAFIFNRASVAAPNALINEAITATNEAYIIFVKDRTIEVKPDDAVAEAGELDNASNQLQFAVFNAWLLQQRKGADMKLPRTE